MSSSPAPILAQMSYVPNECQIFPERIQEYPSTQDLSDDLIERLEEWDWPDEPDDEFDETLAADEVVTTYEWELSVCPSCKVGGHVAWTQNAEVPTCTCGTPMDHLLTLTDSECDGGTFKRWLPIEDRHVWDVRTAADGERRDLAISAIGLDHFVAGSLYVFVCRKCDGWPIRTVYQR